VHGVFVVHGGDGLATLESSKFRRPLRVMDNPEALTTLLHDDKNPVGNPYPIVGDFVVCPTKDQTPGWLTRVDIVSARNMKRE
jgi:hypothetical protein